jgi:ArsR family transcriptional regulator, arsenate/arsenite/antimonite-responsive transcriptional repressor
MAKMSKKISRVEKSSPQQPQAAELKKFLAMVAEPNRLRILYLLKKKSMNVTEIYESLKLPQNLTSHHISRLKKADLLVERREGTFRHYGLNVKQLRKYFGMFKDYLEI